MKKLGIWGSIFGLLFSFAALAKADSFKIIQPDTQRLSVFDSQGNVEFDPLKDPSDYQLTHTLSQAIESNKDLLTAFFKHDMGAVLIDLSNPVRPRWGGVHPYVNFDPASTAKLLVLLGQFQNFFDEDPNPERRQALFNEEFAIRKMMRFSDNFSSGRLQAIASFEKISRAAISHQLYNQENGGLWLGANYLPFAVSLWKFFDAKWWLDLSENVDPISQSLRTGQALQFARLLLMMEQGKIFSSMKKNGAWASRAFKAFIQSPCKSFWAPVEDSDVCIPRRVLGLGVFSDDPAARVWGKDGDFPPTDSEVSLIEGDGYRYILSAWIRNHSRAEAEILFQDFAARINRVMRLENSEVKPWKK